ANSPPVTFVVANPPSLMLPAGAKPNPVNGGLTTMLTTDATSFFGASALSFKWTQGAGSPAPVTFDFGGANKTVNATFTQAGVYNPPARISDPAGASMTTSTTVVVNAGPQISPSPAYVAVGGRQPFAVSGQDQFGNVLSGAPVWSSNCPATVGAIDAAGVF